MRTVVHIMSERKPPSVPRRKRSQVSNASAQSGDRSNQEETYHTEAMTPSPRSSISRCPATPANSRSLGESSPCDSVQSSRASNLSHPLNEQQLASKLDAIALNAKNCLTEEKVRAFLEDCFEDYDSIGDSGFEAWALFFERYYSPDYLFIRPSGNPIDSVGLAFQFSTDTKVMSSKLVSIESITIMQTGRSAVALYTADQVFVYKGTLNEDRTIVTCVMEFRGDEIKIIHEHRTSGRPIPKETRWSSIE